MLAPKRKSKHRPIPLEKYIKIHESYMEYYRNIGIIAKDTLQWNLSERPVVSLEGKIFFSDTSRLCLNVVKYFHIFRSRGRELMKTEKYSYNLNYDSKKRSEIFRYDNYDDSPRRGHGSVHHCHQFDPPGREIRNSPFELHLEEVPTLGEVIEESHAYFLACVE